MVSREGLIAVYMMASRRHGTLYIGVTSNLHHRAWQHQEGALPGFTKRYGCKRLVWYEPHESIVAAIQREKSLKRWPRAWKTNLIERDNPYWDDLYDALVSVKLPTFPTQSPIIPSS
jgi:putative endonuclease